MAARPRVGGVPHAPANAPHSCTPPVRRSPGYPASTAHRGSAASRPPEGPCLPQNACVSSDQPTQCEHTGPRLKGRVWTNVEPTEPPPQPSSGTSPRPSLRTKQHLESVWSQSSSQWPRAWGAGPQGSGHAPEPRPPRLCPSQRGERKRPYWFHDGGLALLPLLASWSFDLKFTKHRWRENEVGEGREGQVTAKR